MLQKTILRTVALLGATLFASTPAAAGELPEPAQEAQPVNARV